ncbi:MAG TPA: TIGR02466 family protein [Polyangiaceae bacterium]|nr:TIGR02466 family protein [Polyangiaceae bacterium]
MSTKRAIERLGLFAVPVFRGVLESFGEKRDELLALVNGERAKTVGLSVSNRGGYRSHDALHAVDAPGAQYLTRAVLEFAVRALRETGMTFADTDLVLSSSWANVDGPGCFHSPHSHYPAHWSGVLYVSVAGCAAEDPSVRDGKIELLNPLPAPQAFHAPTGVTFTPKDGMILLFPGVLSHLVHPHRAQVERVSIAFNLDVLPRRR